MILGEGGELDRLAGDLATTLRERDRLSLRAAALAGVLAEHGYGERQGATSTAEWIRHEFNLSTKAAHDLVNVGLEMETMQASCQAAVEHEIGFDHLAVMARAKRQLGGKRFREEHLLAEAKEISVGRLWHRCQELRHASDPEGMEQEQLNDAERRELVLNQHPDGRVTLGAVFDPVRGAIVRAALEPLAKKLGKDDGRTRDQRMADAMVELCQGNAKPAHLNVTATVGTLYQVPASPAATTDYGALLPGVTVKRIACDCSIGRYVFDSDSVLIDSGRDRRVVSPSQRRALGVRDKHCRFPGCSKPARFCEAHHVVHWIHGAPTNLDNLVCCAGHTIGEFMKGAGTCSSTTKTKSTCSNRVSTWPRRREGRRNPRRPSRPTQIQPLRRNR